IIANYVSLHHPSHFLLTSPILKSQRIQMGSQTSNFKLAQLGSNFSQREFYLTPTAHSKVSHNHDKAIAHSKHKLPISFMEFKWHHHTGL
ncbi:hypothetical protein Ancab_037281, partial [Ancistrocladus abbreviatus]